MSAGWEEETRRLAALARLELAPDEVVALAGAIGSITADFSALARYASTLPEPAPIEPAAPRADETAPASPDEIERILTAAPKVDRATRLVVVPRGLP